MSVTATFSNDRQIEFNPSFRNISEIGSPEEIVDIYVACHYGRVWDKMNSPYAAQMDYHTSLFGKDNGVACLIKYDALKCAYRAASIVLNSCTDDDISDIIGGYEMDGANLKYRHGTNSPEDVIVLSQKILQEGIQGHPKFKTTSSKKSATPSFNCAEYVHSAVGHLNVSLSEAWDLCMTDFVSLMESKFPPTKDEENKNSMTTSDYEMKKKEFAAIRERALKGNK